MNFFSVIISALLFCSLSLANSTGKYRVTGIMSAQDEKTIEIKSGKAVLVVPKKLVPKEQLKIDSVVDIELSKAELDQVKLKH